MRYALGASRVFSCGLRGMRSMLRAPSFRNDWPAASFDDPLCLSPFRAATATGQRRPLGTGGLPRVWTRSAPESDDGGEGDG